MIWKDMYDFSEDSVLLCLASEHYDNAEYIRDYDEYIRVIGQYEKEMDKNMEKNKKSSQAD